MNPKLTYIGVEEDSRANGVAGKADQVSRYID